MSELRKRCEERIKKIVDTKDDGYHAKWYVQDVKALLDALEEVDTRDPGGGEDV